MEVAVLGLGEAGGRIAADLVAAGCAVRGWDPVRRPDGIANAASDREAVSGADVVLSLNAAAVALAAATGVASHLDAGTLYADLNTSSPALKRELAAALPVQFADVALIGIVPRTGLETPALASGAGAERFAELFRPLGMPVDVIGPRPGDAAGLKLLRSVFMKGIAAAAIEAVEAARVAGAEDRVHADIAGVIGEPLLERLLSGSRTHAARRADEMRAAAAYVAELGVSPRITAASAEWLEELSHLDPDEAVVIPTRAGGRRSASGSRVEPPA
jgi:3-hydroxyisobutyrate dehydrogenase-like beta-hydroxyacid dehydrogenase